MQNSACTTQQQNGIGLNMQLIGERVLFMQISWMSQSCETCEISKQLTKWDSNRTRSGVYLLLQNSV